MRQNTAWVPILNPPFRLRSWRTLRRKEAGRQVLREVFLSGARGERAYDNDPNNTVEVDAHDLGSPALPSHRDTDPRGLSRMEEHMVHGGHGGKRNA